MFIRLSFLTHIQIWIESEQIFENIIDNLFSKRQNLLLLRCSFEEDQILSYQWYLCQKTRWCQSFLRQIPVAASFDKSSKWKDKIAVLSLLDQRLKWWCSVLSRFQCCDFLQTSRIKGQEKNHTIIQLCTFRTSKNNSSINFFYIWPLWPVSINVISLKG